MARYETLLRKEKELYLEGAPVIISKSALVKDNMTESVLLQVKFKTIDKKSVKGLTINVDAFDVKGEKIEGIKEYQYLDIKESKGFFGSNVAVKFPIHTTRDYEIFLVDATFSDGSIWRNQGEDCEEIPQKNSFENFLRQIPIEDEEKTIREKFDNQDINYATELCKQYNIELGELAIYEFRTYKDLWYCPCGEIHKDTTEECDYCKNTYNHIKNASDYQWLKERVIARLEEEEEQKRIKKLEEERIQKEKEEEEERKRIRHRERIKKTKSIIKKIAIIILILAVTTGIGIGIYFLNKDYIQPKRTYEQAMEFRKEKKYNESIRKFESLGDYKDCENQILETKYQLAKAYFTEGKYEESKDGFQSVGVYKDSKEMAEKAQNLYIKQLLKEGKQLLKEKNYKKAYDVLEQTCDSTDEGEKIIERSYYKRAKEAYRNREYKRAYKLLNNIIVYDDSYKRRLWKRINQKLSDNSYRKKHYIAATDYAVEAGDRARKMKAEYAYVKAKNKSTDFVASYLADLVKHNYKDSRQINDRLFSPYVKIKINDTGNYEDGNQTVYASEYDYDINICLKVYGVNDYIETNGIKLKYTIVDVSGTKRENIPGRWSNKEMGDVGSTWMIPESRWVRVNVYNRKTDELLGTKSFYAY